MYPFSSTSSSSSSSSSSSPQSPSPSPLSTLTLPTHPLLIPTFLLGGTLTLLGLRVQKRYFRRLEGAEWVTPDVLKRRVWVRGVVTSVGDADGFRLYHTPGFGWRWPFKVRRVPSSPKELKDKTLRIRMAGVDAPEGAHFGRPAQKHYAEALAWLRGRIEGKMVYCQLLSKDQYGRLVALPMHPPFLLPHILTPFLGARYCVSMQMLRAGWVVVYEQAGAEYGKWGKERFADVEREAQAARRGIWRDGVELEETPAEYKRRYSGANPTPNSNASTGSTPGVDKTKTKAASAKGRQGWLRRLGF